MEFDRQNLKVSSFRKSDTGCLPTDEIVDVTLASDGTAWLGTYQNGLVHLDPLTQTCTTYGQTEGLPFRDITGLYWDDQERLWMSSNSGLALFEPLQGSFTLFSEADGLQSNTFYFQSHHRSKSGKLYYGGSHGFNVIDANNFVLDKTPAPVHLTSLLVDAQPHPLTRTPTGIEPITLRPDQRDVEFQFAALDLRQPEKNRYRVRLIGENTDTGWDGLGNSAEVRYPSLTSGRYTFQVQGAGSNGVWNQEGASLTFRIRYPYYQTVWFWASVTLATGLLLFSLYRYRLQQLRRVELTRHRIADDLHDEIGSKISTVALRLDMTGRHPDLPEVAQHQLSELADTSRRLVDDLRDVVWIVDATYDRLPQLVARMQQVADQMLRGRRVRFEVSENLPEVAVDMEWRRHVYLFFREALHNLVRHSQAAHVVIEITAERQQVRLRVEDDGDGFDPEAARHGRGLETLQRRAEQLGGTYAVTSARGHGTTVTLVAPLP